MDHAHKKITLMPGCYVEPGVELEEKVYVGPNAVILSHSGNDLPKTILRAGGQVGANATVLQGVTIGVRAQVKPGSVVTKSVPPLAIVEGNPARIIGYVETGEKTANDVDHQQSVRYTHKLAKVKDVSLHRFSMVPDLRGNLSVGEFEREIPFTPSRYFLVLDVPTAETRGEHAHRKCKQFLIAVKGSVSVVADDGFSREEFLLNQPNIGLYLPAMTWGIQYRYSADAVLLVFASDFYDPNDYIRDYDEFLNLVQSQKYQV
jgi:UDP-2-acetamido-3-amino-2,3-dideoxy-glucuronate N-acetyltransferase